MKRQLRPHALRNKQQPTTQGYNGRVCATASGQCSAWLSVGNQRRFFLPYHDVLLLLVTGVRLATLLTQNAGDADCIDHAVHNALVGSSLVSAAFGSEEAIAAQ